MLSVQPAAIGANRELVSSPSFSECHEVLQEQVWSQAGQALAMSNLSQKTIEKKERELVEAIRSNYSRIKDVEKELVALQLQLKLTAGPKKQALEMIRKKIELQNEKVVAVRQRCAVARQVLTKVEDELRVEEAAKEQLCCELNLLVQQSAQAQLDKMEELKRKLEALSPPGGVAKPQEQLAPTAAGPPAAPCAMPAGLQAAVEPSCGPSTTIAGPTAPASSSAPAPSQPQPAQQPTEHSANGSASQPVANTAGKPRPRGSKDASRDATPGTSPRRPLDGDAEAAPHASSRMQPPTEQVSLAASLAKSKAAAQQQVGAAGSGPPRIARPLSSGGTTAPVGKGLAAAKAQARSSGNLQTEFQGFDS